MKKKICLSVFILQILSVYAADNGFRDYQWGDALEKIRETEESRIIEEDQNRILCGGKHGCHDCTIVYIFNKGKLFCGMYVLRSETGNENLLYENYLSSGISFTDVYGESSNDSAGWLTVLLQDRKNEYGLERERINLIDSNSWNNNGTYISNFFGRSYFIHYHIIFYMDNRILENINELDEEFWKNVFFN